jgi:hypothetical protein
MSITSNQAHQSHHISLPNFVSSSASFHTPPFKQVKSRSCYQTRKPVRSSRFHKARLVTHVSIVTTDIAQKAVLVLCKFVPSCMLYHISNVTSNPFLQVHFQIHHAKHDKLDTYRQTRLLGTSRQARHVKHVPSSMPRQARHVKHVTPNTSRHAPHVSICHTTNISRKAVLVKLVPLCMISSISWNTVRQVRYFKYITSKHVTSSISSNICLVKHVTARFRHVPSSWVCQTHSIKYVTASISTQVRHAKHDST